MHAGDSSFHGIYGHENKVALLRAAIRNNRVSHAYLFYGMSGVGKKAIAVVFAKALNCVDEENGPCDRCPSCLKIERRSHPDVVGISPEGQFIRIKEIRELQNHMVFRPLEGRKRIFIVDEADRMNSAAANALLKTLEEPSAANVLILVTSRPHGLPMTILSRCQQVRFDPLPVDVIVSFLKERFTMDEGPARLLAASSGGSIGRAMELKEDSYIELKNNLIDGISNIRAPRDFSGFLKNFGNDRESVLARLDILNTWFRDILVYKETGESDRLIHQDRIEKIRSLSEEMTGPGLIESMAAVSQARTAIERNANKQLTLEMMMFRLFPAKQVQA